MVSCLKIALCVLPYVLIYGFSLRLQPISPSRRRAEDAIRKYCDHSKYTFMKCRKELNGEYSIKAGYYGVGILADLINDPVASNVKIYEDCPPNHKNSTHAILSEACYVDPTKFPIVPVFIKLLQSTADTAVLRTNKSISAFDEEVRRARSCAFLKLNGHHITPAIYDILDLTTNKIHDIQHQTYFQALLNAKTGDNVRTEIFVLEEHIITAVLINVATHFNNNTGPLARVVRRAHNEMWMRFRLRLRLADTILDAVLQLWKARYVHCDLHLGNVMQLTSYVTDPEELLDILHNGKAVAPTVNAFYYNPALPSVALTQLGQVHADGSVGVPVTYFDASSVRYIDTSFMMQLPETTDSNAPCFINRGERHEDIAELWRGGISLIFSKPSGKKWDTVVATVMREMQDDSWTKFVNNSGDLAQQIKSTLTSIETVISSLNNQLGNVEELINCQKQRSIAPNLVKDAVRRNSFTEALEHLGGKDMCSLDTMIIGVEKWRNIIKTASDALPNDIMKAPV